MLFNAKIKDRDYKYTLGIRGGGKDRASKAISGMIKISLRKAAILPSQSYYFNSERQQLVLQWQNIFQIFKLKTTNSSSTSFLKQDDFIRDQLLKCSLIKSAWIMTAQISALSTLEIILRLILLACECLFMQFFPAYNKNSENKTYLQQISSKYFRFQITI